MVFFAKFLVETRFIGGKPKKNLQKNCLSLNHCSGHNFGPIECCKSLHRSFLDSWLNGDFYFFEKNYFPDFLKHHFFQFSPKNTPSVYWILSIEICVVQHGVSVNHKPILVGTPHWSKKNWQKIHFCVQKWTSKNPNFPPKNCPTSCLKKSGKF